MLTTATLELIDTAVCDRVLVYGSLPPMGRDLDLLARSPEVLAVQGALVQAGFISTGMRLARWGAGCAEAVELVPAGSWGLPPHELDALFDEARPLDGARRLVRPSACHVLLIAALRLMHEPVLAHKLRVRVDAALAEDPNAWRQARERAGAWHAARALALLETAYQDHGRIPASGRLLAHAEQLSGFSRRSLRSNLRILRSFVSLPRPARAVAFSGLDGAGKSLQANLVREALEAVGCSAIVVWTPIGSNPVLTHISAPIKRTLRRLPRVGTWSDIRDRLTAGRAPLADLEDVEDRRSRFSALAAALWATTLAVVNVAAYRRAMLREFGHGHIVIFDRYTLDSAVNLRFLYGDGLLTRLLIAFIHRTVARPIRAYLLDVPAELTLQRKQQEWSRKQQQRRALLYQSECVHLGVQRLAGAHPADELCARIAAEIWCALPGAGKQRRRAHVQPRQALTGCRAAVRSGGDT